MSAEWVAGSVDLKDCSECDSAEKVFLQKLGKKFLLTDAV
jgi:hypothetical protein